MKTLHFISNGENPCPFLLDKCHDDNVFINGVFFIQFLNNITIHFITFNSKCENHEPRVKWTSRSKC